MDDGTQRAFDERIDWLNAVTSRAKDGKLDDVWEAINDVDAEHLRSLVFALVLARVDDYDRIRDHYAEWARERLETAGPPPLSMN